MWTTERETHGAFCARHRFPGRSGFVVPELGVLTPNFYDRQLLIPSESAHDTIEALGQLGKLQFRDLNEKQAAFSKTYASQVKRCDEMKRQIGFIEEQVEKSGLPMGGGLVFGGDERHIELDVLESRLGRLEKELLQLVENSEQLERSYHELHELQLVLETAGSFFDDSRSRAGAMDDPSSRESTSNACRHARFCSSFLPAVPSRINALMHQCINAYRTPLQTLTHRRLQPFR